MTSVCLSGSDSADEKSRMDTFYQGPRGVSEKAKLTLRVPACQLKHETNEKLQLAHSNLCGTHTGQIVDYRDSTLTVSSDSLVLTSMNIYWQSVAHQ